MQADIELLPEPKLPRWHETTIEDWHHFVGVVKDYRGVGSPVYTRYAFRGQPDANEPLRPTLIRDYDQPSYDYLEVERSLRDEMKAVAHLHQASSHLTGTDDTFEWWALMQHFGMPTRMLDWTASAYVAAYFATADAPWAKDGAVWLFSLDMLAHEMAQRNAPDISKAHFFAENNPELFLYAYYERKRSDRSWAQQGLFTVCTDVTADHGQILSEVFRDRHKSDWLKIIIPGHIKSHILWHLRAVNVTAAALFPGLAGIGRAGRELWSLALARVGD